MVCADRQSGPFPAPAGAVAAVPVVAETAPAAAVSPQSTAKFAKPCPAAGSRARPPLELTSHPAIPAPVRPRRGPAGSPSYYLLNWNRFKSDISLRQRKVTQTQHECARRCRRADESLRCLDGLARRTGCGRRECSKRPNQALRSTSTDVTTDIQSRALTVLPGRSCATSATCRVCRGCSGIPDSNSLRRYWCRIAPAPRLPARSNGRGNARHGLPHQSATARNDQLGT